MLISVLVRKENLKAIYLLGLRGDVDETRENGELFVFSDSPNLVRERVEICLEEYVRDVPISVIGKKPGRRDRGELVGMGSDCGETSLVE
jgi:hypothetical protein